MAVSSGDVVTSQCLPSVPAQGDDEVDHSVAVSSGAVVTSQCLPSVPAQGCDAVSSGDVATAQCVPSESSVYIPILIEPEKQCIVSSVSDETEQQSMWVNLSEFDQLWIVGVESSELDKQSMMVAESGVAMEQFTVDALSEDLSEVVAESERRPAGKGKLVDSSAAADSDSLFSDSADDDRSSSQVLQRRRGKRKYDKTLACVFCHKLLKMKIKRHLRTVHKDEPEVARLMKLSDAKEADLGFARLRARGNFNHNTDALESGRGSLIVSRRARLKRSPRKYLPCVHCLNMFLSKDLYRHSRRCPVKKASDPSVKEAVKTASRYLLSGVVNSYVSPKFKTEVLDNMRHDDISKTCEKDEIILRFGLSLHARLGRRRANDISQRMRQLGRLLIAVNSERDVEPLTLNECLTGKVFDDVVNATEKLCQSYDDPTGRPLFRNPSLGLKVGHSLAKCAEIKKGMALRTSDVIMAQEAESFLLLHKCEWTNRVSSSSLASLKQKRYNNPDVLPLTSDLLKLRQYLSREIPRLSRELEDTVSSVTYRSLIELVYTRLVIFNKRRCGETARLLLDAVVNRPRWEETAQHEIVATLQPLEKQLLKRFVLLSCYDVI